MFDGYIPHSDGYNIYIIIYNPIVFFILIDVRSLVGGWPTPLNIFFLPNWMESHDLSIPWFQSTNQIMLAIWLFNIAMENPHF